MSARQHSPSGPRSDRKIPKLRTRGRANRQKLLDEVQRLIHEHGSRPVRFSEVFKSAGVSRGSAYRIYDGIDDLMQDLSSSWMRNFVLYMKYAEPVDQPESWVELSDALVAQAASFWVENADTLSILPRVNANAPASYRAALRNLTEYLAATFDEHFIMRDIPGWLPALAMYTGLGDAIFSDAVGREGMISEERLVEAQKICSTYLSFYLPTWLKSRDGDA